MKRIRILISPNSFKECADSVTIAGLIKENLINLANSELIVKPISDGGDGFLNVCKYYFGGEIRKYNIITAFDDSRFDCPVLYCNERQAIYIESAEVLGLKVVPRQYRNPLKLTSNGLGELLVKLNEDVRKGGLNVRKVFIGVGGTATIDMGMGMMSELGLKFFDIRNQEITVLPENYLKVQGVNYERVTFSFDISCIIDVTNPLLGRDNGIETYGYQKGADEEIISILIKSFNHLINLFENNNLVIVTESLSGAGGGIPAALQIFFKVNPIPSTSFLENLLSLSDYVDRVDYLIIGEGAYDQQSAFGKGADTLIHLLRNQVKKIFLVCGKIDSDSQNRFPPEVYPIELHNFFDNPIDSIQHYRIGIKLACDKIIKELDF